MVGQSGNRIEAERARISKGADLSVLFNRNLLLAEDGDVETVTAAILTICSVVSAMSYEMHFSKMGCVELL